MRVYAVTICSALRFPLIRRRENFRALPVMRFYVWLKQVLVALVETEGFPRETPSDGDLADGAQASSLDERAFRETKTFGSPFSLQAENPATEDKVRRNQPRTSRENLERRRLWQRLFRPARCESYDRWSMQSKIRLQIWRAVNCARALCCVYVPF
jgi:hypothetical protein